MACLATRGTYASLPWTGMLLWSSFNVWWVPPGSWPQAFTKFLLYEGLSQFTCQCWSCKRCRFDPWVGKIPWSRKCRPIPVFLPGKFHGQRSLWATVHGATESHHSLVFNLSYSHCRVKHLMCIYACKMCFAMWMHVLLFLFFWLHHAACGILVPWPGIASMP